MYQYYRDRTKESNTRLQEVKHEKDQKDIKKAFRERKREQAKEPLDSEVIGEGDDEDDDSDYEVPSLEENVNVYPDEMPETIERKTDISDIGEMKGRWKFRN